MKGIIPAAPPKKRPFDSALRGLHEFLGDEFALFKFKGFNGFLHWLGAPILDSLYREKQMQLIVGEWHEAILGVKFPGLGIDGQDFDCKYAELFGKVQATAQGIAQESLSKPLTLGFQIDGQPPKQNNRDGMLGDPLGGFRGKICDCDGAGRKRVITSHLRRAGKCRYEGTSQAALFILARSQTQKVIQGRFSAGKLSAIMGGAQRFDSPFSHGAITLGAIPW